MANVLEMLSTLGTPNENTTNPDLNARLRSLVTAPAAEIPAGLPVTRNEPDPNSPQGLLGALRQRIKQQVADEPSRQISDLGMGLLASRSPNFFTALGEGLQSSEQAARARQEELRRVVEQESTIADRAARLEEDRARRLQEQPLTAARIDQIREEIRRGGAANWTLAGQDRTSGDLIYINSRDPNQRITLPGVQATQTARFSTQAENALRERALVQARTAADNERNARAQTSRIMDQAEWNARVRELERDNLASFGLLPLPGSATATTPGGTGQQSGQGNPPVTRERFVPPDQRR